MNLLITGGTGSLGRALVKRILPTTIPKICIYSRDEHKQEDMRRTIPDPEGKLRFFIGDVRDKDRLKLACEGATHIVHAAALKVVPIGEYNPFEVVKTNVLGAQNLVDAALSFNYGNYPKVIAVSTDKAVSPINLYGATKLCAEKIILAANNIRGSHGPRFSVVRYGNVANSNGSVIPVYKSMVAIGEQLPVTHPDMTRFWITLEQAVDLILYTFDNMIGGETIIPVMPSFRVIDLATLMMEEYPPEKNWPRISGVRPGEKLHEDIITEQEAEKTLLTEDEKYYIIGRPQEHPPLKSKLASNTREPMSKDWLRDRLKELGE